MMVYTPLMAYTHTDHTNHRERKIAAKYRRRSPIAALIGVLGMLALAPAAAQAAGSETDYIVLYKSGTNVTAKVQSEEARGNDVQDVFRSAVKGFVAPLDAADVARLRARSDVLLVEKDKPVKAFSASPRSGPAASWGLDRIDQRTLPLNGWISTSQNGFGVTAYIIDSGIRVDHSEFGGRVTVGFDAVGGDPVPTNDCNGHGTHVAGTVGGKTYGVAPQVSLVAVRVLDCNGDGSTSGVIAGIDWATADHAAGVPAVANMSLGSDYSEALNMATQNAITDGISFVVAAGNDNADACRSSPASTPNAITVAATDPTEARASYSNFGSCVDIFAPGSNIISSRNTSPTAANTRSGTSMASPHVAGAAALILSGIPSSTPAQVATALTDASTTGVVTDPASTVNRLLFIVGGSVPNPTPAPPARFDLVLSKSGTGVGTVTSSPAGIDCGSDCSETLVDGASVPLTAKPTTGSSFAGWSGSGCSGTSTCTVTILGARFVDAKFTKLPSNNFRVHSVKVGVNGLTSTFVVPGRGKPTQRVMRTAGGLTVCKTSAKATKAGTVKLTCKLSSATRAALRKRSLRVSVKTTFTPTGGLTASKTKLIKLLRQH